MNDSVAARISNLNGPSCRRLLALAWWGFRAADSDATLRDEVRDAFASGAITGEQIETEWKGMQ